MYIDYYCTHRHYNLLFLSFWQMTVVKYIIHVDWDETDNVYCQLALILFNKSNYIVLQDNSFVNDFLFSV